MRNSTKIYYLISSDSSFLIYEKDILEPMPSQSPSLEENREDTLIGWQLETEIQILVIILLVGIILVVGYLNRRVEKALLFALFLSGIIIVFFFTWLG